MKEGRESWCFLFVWFKERVLTGVRFIADQENDEIGYQGIVQIEAVRLHHPACEAHGKQKQLHGHSDAEYCLKIFFWLRVCKNLSIRQKRNSGAATLPTRPNHQGMWSVDPKK